MACQEETAKEPNHLYQNNLFFFLSLLFLFNNIFPISVIINLVLGQTLEPEKPHNPLQTLKFGMSRVIHIYLTTRATQNCLTPLPQ